MFSPSQGLCCLLRLFSILSAPLLSSSSVPHAARRHYFMTPHSPHLHPKTRKMKSTLPLIVFFLLATISTSTAQTPPTFKCTSRATCEALIDYVPINATTYSDIKTLFGVKNHRDILGANNLPLSTSPNTTVPPQQKVKIPFPCICTNGTGISNKRPMYTVKPGDTLDFIGRSLFSNLVTYQQIASVNNIRDVNLIEVGWNLTIPLPCSCDDVDGVKVVHYGFVVPDGSTVSQIADQYNTTESTLLGLNNMTDANELKADAVLHVPVRACTSAMKNNSLDSSLLVASGTYTFTANNCVQCKCNNTNNFTLQCDPSPVKTTIPNWGQCPSMQCEGINGLMIGNASSSTSCGNSICAYAGYTNQAILTTLLTGSTCPTDGSGNGATKIGSQWLSWASLLISVEMGLLGYGLL